MSTDELKIEDKLKTMQHYCFWLWEYQRRNNTYRAKYQQYANPSPPRVIDNTSFGKIYTAPTEKILFEIFMIFGRRTKDPQIGPNSQDILSEMLDGNFKFPQYTLSEMEPLFIRDTRFICRQEGVKFKHPVAEKDAIRLAINVEKEPLDPHKKLKKIQKLVALVYYRHQIDMSMDDLLGQEHIGVDADRKALLAYLEVLNDIRMERGPQKIKKETDVSRAVGLWLWDYTSQNEVGALEAEEEIFKQFDKLYNHKQFLETRSIRRFLNNTGKCIERGEVLDIAHS